ncbi:uncharacterized protein [Cherax quadricarinatus]|uniref:uncharacterized protein isoform X1 n=1 Tax=Cherax quadricarinatus TaxID=27406 RepID=UPI002377DE16|nr:uncharacterized protein LOC128687582 isoform X1 [Cherax quadricarinatus]XP_053631076.1 uncharacterized protein LOC128687582 isoform X1 [Cherax quadricarinatus]XP_053631078.1 uncharacterized protein LOC128687582 isoform X1 [Cherax quadricarinatus]
MGRPCAGQSLAVPLKSTKDDARQVNRGRTVVVLWSVVGAAVLTTLWTLASTANYPTDPRIKQAATRPSKEPCLSQDMRRRLAASLTRLQRDIKSQPGMSEQGGRWWRELGKVAAQLDPRLHRETLRPATLVCPEHYDGTKFIVERCTGTPPLAKLVSVVVPARGWHPSRVSQVVRGLNTGHNLTIILILSNDDPPPDTNKSVLVLRYDDTVSDGKALHEALANVNTSFVFLGDSLAYFSWQHSSLQRLLRVLDRLGGEGVAGGSYRDEQGQWRHGCLQRSLTNYHATFLSGYQHSAQECMYCDDVLGPVLTSTRLLQHVPFSHALSGPALYRDWHTRVTQAGYLTLACPDVMFFLQEEPIMDTTDWKIYATQWSLQSVHSYDDEQYSFTCSEVGIRCSDLRKKITWYLVPPCCREAIMGGITILDNFAQEKGLSYELHHGSLLGAVKLGAFLPWDFDQDIYYNCKDRRTWETLDDFLKTKNTGCHMRMSTARQLVLQCTTFFVDMVCRKPLTGHTLPLPYRNVTTWVEYGKRRVSVMANPGNAIRDQIGPENLRHAQHWRVPGRPDPGAWRPCQTPATQSCLDHHPADGSLTFSHPPVCLP